MNSTDSSPAVPVEPDARTAEQKLVALYMELTGVGEKEARGVYGHLDLMRGRAAQFGNSVSPWDRN